MRIRNIQVLLLLVLVVASFSATLTEAQTTEFTYQGRLLFGDLPASGSYDFVFTLYDSATGGSVVGSPVALSAVNVNNGVFSVRIDFGDKFPGASRFLEIKVRPSGTTDFAALSPLQSISSAPYSIKSLNSATAANATSADQLGGVAASQFIVTSDSRLSDARNPLPNSSNYIQNTISPQGSSNFNISGVGTANILSATTQFNIGSTKVLSMFGAGNLFVGGFAGNVNTIGINNTFSGFFAGGSNTSGSQNTFVGNSAGNLNTTASSNSFVGSNAGQFNTTGNFNSFFGALAGTANTFGNQNSFFGEETGKSNTSGPLNSFFGYKAGQANSSAGLNSFFGAQAGLANTFGNQNSFFGVLAGSANTTGGMNTFFGELAGDTNTTGNGNTLVGFFTDTATTGLSNASAFGSRALVGQSNSLVLGSINGVNGAVVDTNVGIGTTTPADRFHIRVNSGNVLFGGAGCNAGFAGLGFGASLSECANYSLLGNGTDTIVNRPAGGVIAFRENNATQLSIASGGLVSISTLGTGGTATLCRNSSGQISTCSALQGEGSDTFVRSTGGSVHLRSAAGDLTLSPTGSVTVSGLLSLGLIPTGGSVGLCLSGTTIATCSSSIRYKTNVNSFHPGLDLIRRLRPVTFNWKSDNARDVGLVAEEVNRVEPLLTTKNAKGEVDGVKYDRVGVVLVNAVNEQQALIESQQEQIDEQRETIKRQQAELNALKRIVCKHDPKAELCRPGISNQ